MSSRRIVLGVIGHVDHGKSALVEALTGMPTDRLAEERRRGISIVLGFAHLTVEAAGETFDVDVIDMPGHERFVRTMVSGATGIDSVLLVVAADEGIKPQTIEHADIAALVGVTRTVIVLTKADLVAPARLAEVGAEAASLAAASGLTAGAPIATSARTGAGIPALKRAIAACAAAARPAPDHGFCHLPIDRAFSVAGHGTVVTGTLRHGTLRTNDELALLPGTTTVRVRGLQVHRAAVKQAEPGQRVAINLRGIEVAAVGRGMALATPGALPPSRLISVSLTATRAAPALRNNTRLRLLHGTRQDEARIRLLDRDALEPGQSGFAQLSLPAVGLPARTRFILRGDARPATVAGGIVLDPTAERLRRHDRAALARLAALARETQAATVTRELDEAGQAGRSVARLAALAGLAPARVMALLAVRPIHLGRANIAVRTSDFADLRTALLGRLAEGDQTEEQLARRHRQLPTALLDEALDSLAAESRLRRQGGRVTLVRADEDARRAASEADLAASLAATLREGGLTPPTLETLRARDPARRKALDRLVRDGEALRTFDRVQKREILFHRDAIERAKSLLEPTLATGAALTISEAGALLGISRKYSVPLLEYLDSIPFTRRIADKRILAPRRS